MQGLSLTLPENTNTIALALSGGADSMALLHMLAQLHPDIHAITVDHGLRDDSADEAAKIGAWVSDWPNVRHIILRWDGTKPSTGRMEAARAARYGLMAEYCRTHDITHLAVAHHADDQAETFFMRLTHGSGLDGLAAMREMQRYDDDVTLWRPLLGQVSHDDLVAYCRGNDVKWVEDPTNRNTAYTRNRLRLALKDEGLSEKRLASTMRRLGRASDALRQLSVRLLDRARTSNDDSAWTLDLSMLKAEPFELSVRVIRMCIDELGHGGEHGARFERVEDIATHLLNTAVPQAYTLGGCTLRANPRRQTLVIARENTDKAVKLLPLTADAL
jgi:tRNA(Ile)-lysidine synthase